jgi:hypothetical protein
VAANTYLNQEVPLGMQGRVFALQGAIKNATAIGRCSPQCTRIAGGVQPVPIVTPVLIFALALYGASKFHRRAAAAGLPPPERRRVSTGPASTGRILA